MSHGFLLDLARLGPDAVYAPWPLARARIYCRRLTETHYENFSVASLLLPRRLLPHFQAIYAYCRWADDLGDETGGGEEALSLLRWWRDEFSTCCAGQPHHPVMVALATTMRRFQIPPDPFLALLSAFEQDQRVRRYATYDQLLDYCRRSANPVGHLVLYLCGCYDEKRAVLADHICTGLQLANFWQDVSRDLDIGRVYLPEEDRRRFGYSDEDLQARRFTLAFRELLHFEVERARNLFHQGMPLLPLVPANVRCDIELFLQGGFGILDRIAAQDFDVWQRRPVLSKWDKATLLGGVWLRHWLQKI